MYLIMNADKVYRRYGERLGKAETSAYLSELVCSQGLLTWPKKTDSTLRSRSESRVQINRFIVYKTNFKNVTNQAS